ncbi:MAG: hypothetical protein ACRDTA_30815 [Pseudonocardiaceae bacterium]
MNEPGRASTRAYFAGEWANAYGALARLVESTLFARRSTAEARKYLG